MGSLLLRALLVWFVVSLVVMMTMTAFVLFRRRLDTGDGRSIIDLGPAPDTLAAQSGAGVIGPATQSDMPPSPERETVSDDSSTMARLLAGAALPCELRPGRSNNDDRWTYATRGYQPRIVALSLVEEFQRMGLEVIPVGYTEARVRRDGLELTMILHAAPDSLDLDFDDATTDAGETIVEFIA